MNILICRKMFIPLTLVFDVCFDAILTESSVKKIIGGQPKCGIVLTLYTKFMYLCENVYASYCLLFLSKKKQCMSKKM